MGKVTRTDEEFQHGDINHENHQRETLEVNKILSEINNPFNVLIHRMDSAEENQNKENKISPARENIQFPLGRQKKSCVD